MWAKRTAVDLEPNRFTGNLYVVMQQLESRILSNADPYDASSPKVRERPDTANVHHELAVPSRHRREDVFDLADSLVRLIAEELEGEMEERLANPGELRSAVTKWRGRACDVAAYLGREIDREKKTHSVFCVSRPPTPTAR